MILKSVLSRTSLGLERLSGDSLKGACKNQCGSGSTFSVWVWIDFRVILERVLSRISLGLDRLSGDSSEGCFQESIWVWIDFRVILRRVLSRIMGLGRLSGDSLKVAFKNQFGFGSNFA